MPDKRVLVVGTTADYIELIMRRFPGQALFLTDEQERLSWRGQAPDEASEVLCSLLKSEETIGRLHTHLAHFDIIPDGVACFDCESLALASDIAVRYGLPFSSGQAVANSRSKFESKKLWSEVGVCCPKAVLIDTLDDLLAFSQSVNGPIIVKPLSGSGSELVFKCQNKMDCLRAYHALKTGLAGHPNERMYLSDQSDGAPNARSIFVAEEYITGREYSCDLVLDGDRLDIIRIAKKIFAPDQPPGTTLAYILPAVLPGELSTEIVRDQLHSAARALGLTRSMIMVDFIIKGDRAYLLEMTPRPGGDCLPPLIKECCGFDMLGAALDFARGNSIIIPPIDVWKRHIGLRLIAEQEGTVSAIEVSELLQDDRVRYCEIKRTPGHKIVLPPDDYDSRLIGNVVFQPRGADIMSECLELTGKVKIKMEASKWALPQGNQ